MTGDVSVLRVGMGTIVQQGLRPTVLMASTMIKVSSYLLASNVLNTSPCRIPSNGLDGMGWMGWIPAIPFNPPTNQYSTAVAIVCFVMIANFSIVVVAVVFFKIFFKI